MATATHDDSEALTTAIVSGEHDAVCRLLASDPSLFGYQHFDLFRGRSTEAVLLSILRDPRARLALTPYPHDAATTTTPSGYVASLFHLAIYQQRAELARAVIDAFDPSGERHWINFYSWTELMRRAHDLGDSFVPAAVPTQWQPPGSTEPQREVILSLEARLTLWWLRRPDVPDKFGIQHVLCSYLDSTRCHQKDVIDVLLADPRVQDELRTTNVLHIMLGFHSVRILSAYLDVSAFPVDRTDIADAWKKDAGLARRLVASPKFRPLSACEKDDDLPAYRYESAFVDWLQSLPVACLRVTASDWRQDRRRRRSALSASATRSFSASVHRAESPTASSVKTSKKRPRDRSSVSDVDADGQPPARKRHRPNSDDAPVRSYLWTVSLAMIPVRAWIDAIESTLMKQDADLPSDWIHGLLVDLLLGPEYTT
jgi:hypothetical protein